jgi:peptidyl-prolyl cis-trans isomerase A (cyclophilin A)
MTPTAPATYKVQFETTQGNFTVEVNRDWAPRGADRFYELVTNGFFDDQRFFRVLEGFVVQFGIHGDPKTAAAWRANRIEDDPVKTSNVRGAVTFATAGPNTRTTQVFVNFGDNSQLDSMGFAPFGRVTNGMDVLEKLYSGYGEGAPRGRGPDQGRIQGEGNAYMDRDFAKLDRLVRATIS